MPLYTQERWPNIPRTRVNTESILPAQVGSTETQSAVETSLPSQGQNSVTLSSSSYIMLFAETWLKPEKFFLEPRQGGGVLIAGDSTLTSEY